MERPYGDKLKGIGVWPGGGGTVGETNYYFHKKVYFVGKL